MAGYQFAHIATHSRRGNGRHYSSVADITAEAARLAGAAPHVTDPQPPSVLFGMSPESIPAKLDQRIALAGVKIRGSDRRPIRKDTHVLESQVHSHPAYTRPPPSDFASRAGHLGEPQVHADYLAWRARTIAFVRWDAERRGLEVLSIVEHLDESHPHVHAYLAPNSERHDAKATHPGHAAQKGSQTKKAATIAYRDAMRDWQDDVWRQIGEPSGLTRYGPKLDRLTRAEWHRRQHEVELAGEMQRKTNIQAGELSALAAQVQGARDAVREALAQNDALKAEIAGHVIAREQLHIDADAEDARRRRNTEAADREDQRAIEARRALERMCIERGKADADLAEIRRATTEQAKALADAEARAARTQVAALERIQAAKKAEAEAAVTAHQVALLARASDDERLALRTHETRGFLMEEAAMNEGEVSAYRRPWAEWLRTAAIELAKRLMQMRVRRALAERKERDRIRDIDAREAAAAAATTRADRLASDLQLERGRLAAAFDAVTIFISEVAAIPVSERSPRVRSLLARAADLRKRIDPLVKPAAKGPTASTSDTPVDRRPDRDRHND